MGQVYKIYFDSNYTKEYIGSSRNYAKRMSSHKTLLNTGVHPNKGLQTDYNIYKHVMKSEVIYDGEDFRKVEHSLIASTEKERLYNKLNALFSGVDRSINTYCVELRKVYTNLQELERVLRCLKLSNAPDYGLSTVLSSFSNRPLGLTFVGRHDTRTHRPTNDYELFDVAEIIAYNYTKNGGIYWLVEDSKLFLTARDLDVYMKSTYGIPTFMYKYSKNRRMGFMILNLTSRDIIHEPYKSQLTFDPIQMAKDTGLC